MQTAIRGHAMALAILAALLTLPAGAAEAPGIRPIFGIQADLRAASGLGLTIEAVVPGSLAATLGLQEGDVLLTVQGQPITSLGDLRKVVDALHPGQRVVARYLRQGKHAEGAAPLAPPPTLPSYQVVEGKGIPGVVQLGDTRAHLEAILGKAPGELDRNGIRYLAYPLLGLTLALLPGPDQQPCVALLRLQYPFVGRTGRGLSTVGTTDEMRRVYGHDVERQRDAQPTLDVARNLGIRFVSRGGRIVEVHVLPAETLKKERRR